MNENDCIYIHIPRMKLTGGNQISLLLSRYLTERGLKIKVFTGFSLMEPNSMELKKTERSLFNSFKNIIAFLSCSIFSLFNKNTIATHHLTSVFNFIRPTNFCFVQDLESQFYPLHLNFLGNMLWQNYLLSHKKIFTNNVLANKSGFGLEDIGFSFQKIRDPIVCRKKDIDVIMILRDGDYKSFELTILVHEFLLKRKINSLLINASRKKMVLNSSMESLNQEELFRLFGRSSSFLCLSKWEGLGLPNIESYLHGCHVLTTAIPSGVILNSAAPESITLLSDICPLSISRSIESILCSQKEYRNEEFKNREAVICGMSEKWWGYINYVFNIGIHK